MLSDLLSKQGYQVQTLPNGHDVVSSVATDPPDLILMGIQMSGLGGIEVMGLLQQREDTRHVPVIMSTSCEAPNDVAEALDAGAVDYIAQPFVEAVILARVKAALRSERARRWLADLNSRLQEQIDEHAKAEKELWASKQRYAMAARAGKVGLWDWNIETDKVYLASNLQAMLGLTLEDLPRNFNEWMQRVHDDDRPRVRAAMMSHLAGDTDNFAIEQRMVHKDGSPRSFIAQGMVEKGAAGKPTRMLGSLTDLTDQKLIEQALCDSETWSNAILENAADGIINCDQQGTIQSFNRAASRIFGYPEEEMVG